MATWSAVTGFYETAGLNGPQAFGTRSAPAHLNLGKALHRKGDLAGAIASYREALRIQPNFTAAKKALEAAGTPLGPLDSGEIERSARGWD